jgi:shikimate dehydrogenase
MTRESEHRFQQMGPAGGKPDAGTRVYAVMGDPVAHSLSPAMHNAGFVEIGYNGVFVAFRVTDLTSAVSGIRALGICGASVTIPHKRAILPLLDEIDPMAAEIGAVNTVLNRNGTLLGANTDCAGAMAALSGKTDVTGRQVWVIGAGGAARAVGHGVVSAGGYLTLLNRTPHKGERLAAELGAEFKPLAEIERVACDVLINTTSVGMVPDTRAMPVTPDGIERGMTVMDIIYNPLKTQLLEIAGSRGCVTVDGVAMFVHQGAAQFELWTGRKAPVDVMQQVVLKNLESKLSGSNY